MLFCRRARLFAGFCAALVGVVGPGPAHSQDVGCYDNNTSNAVRIKSQEITPESIVGLSDIGSLRSYADAPAVTASPDGGKLALQIRRAKPDTNSFCLAMVVIYTRADSKPRIVDVGGELILVTSTASDRAEVPTGVPRVITPRWSPDGKWIAFLKKTDGKVQVWRAWTDGSRAEPLTRTEHGVIDFELSQDGTAITYSSRPQQAELRAEMQTEGLVGYRYDTRFVPLASHAPFVRPAPLIYTRLDLGNGTEEPIVQNQPGSQTSSKDTDAPRQSTFTAMSKSGKSLWLVPVPKIQIPLAQEIVAEVGPGDRRKCSDPACSPLGTSVWWTQDETHVRFLRREGWGGSLTAIYEWSPRSGAVRRLFETEDLLIDCTPVETKLVCLRENSLHPRRIDSIDPETGTIVEIFDPNRNFGQFRLPHVERLKWRNHVGIETFGDLVFPVGYKRGKRYPVIVVQYQSRGFLRGGTGNEYPILPLAARGYAVLSIERPMLYGLLPALHARSFEEAERLGTKDLADRRSVLSSIEAALRMLIDRGIADPARIGITGLSDGASTVQFAALNSSMFRAGVMSSCCWESTQTAYLGPTLGEVYHRAGWPRLSDDDEEFWRKISFARNPERVAFPILMQISDDEYLAALEGYTALKEQGPPTELYVFTNEHHIKWQPAHLLAAYRRTIAWFDHWLKDIPPSISLLPKEAASWGV